MNTNFNKVGTLKEIGAIAYRLNDAALPDALKAAIIARNIENLRDTLPTDQGLMLDCLDAFNKVHDWPYLAEALQHLRAEIPITYGMVTAGTAFTLGGLVWVKRKEFMATIDQGVPYAHLPADTPVTLINH